MNSKKTLSGPSVLKNKNPNKLIFMLHGYGDSAENFINIANSLNQVDFKANYFAFNAPTLIPNYPLGRQWFDLNPNGIYISNAGPAEIKLINVEILEANKLIENTIIKIMNFYQLSFADCILLGFSQGGMMTFEFGNYLKNTMGGLAIISGQILNEDKIINKSLLETPIFISHGDLDEILPINLFNKACQFMNKNKLLYESHKMKGDVHTISQETINLLQKFIKKTL